MARRHGVTVLAVLAFLWRPNENDAVSLRFFGTGLPDEPKIVEEHLGEWVFNSAIYPDKSIYLEVQDT